MWAVQTGALSGMSGGRTDTTSANEMITIVIDAATEVATVTPVAAAAVAAVPTPVAPTAAAAPPPAEPEQKPPEPEAKPIDIPAPDIVIPVNDELKPVEKPTKDVPPVVSAAAAPPPAEPIASATPSVATGQPPVVAAAPPTAGQTSASRGDMVRYMGRVRNHLANHRPNGNGARGKVVVTFTLAVNGDIDEIDVSTSSGSSKADNLALSAVRKAAPFPMPPSQASRTQLTFAIPFEFR